MTVNSPWGLKSMASSDSLAASVAGHSPVYADTVAGGLDERDGAGLGGDHLRLAGVLVDLAGDLDVVAGLAR